jgi:hypothetical protein
MAGLFTGSNVTGCSVAIAHFRGNVRPGYAIPFHFTAVDLDCRR